MSPLALIFLTAAIGIPAVGAPSQTKERPAASAAPRYVFAHWHIPMPYLPGQPDQERAKADVLAAIEEGLDGFAFNAFSGSQARFMFQTYGAAADAVGADNFRFFLSADLGLGFPPKEIVDTVVQFAGNRHYLKINGKPFLSTYGGEKIPNERWESDVIQPLKAQGHPVTFVPYFDRKNPNWEDPSYANWAATVNLFPVVDGLFNFRIPGSTPFYVNDPEIGHHWWSALEGEENLAKALHGQNKIFMSSYMPYYWAVCHSAREYLEYEGGRGMANTWTSIITKQKPELVELVTWNDYTESTYFQPTRLPMTQSPAIPSYPHLGYYELLKYYISWFHSGQPPRIAKDAFFYFYRPNLARNPNRATDSFCSMGPVPNNQIWGTVHDAIYLTAVLTAGAEIRITSGTASTSHRLPPGITSIEVPLNAGTQKFELWRDSSLLAVNSGLPAQLNLAGDNYNVYAGYSIAGGADDKHWLPTAYPQPHVRADWFTSPQ